jgi:hypothetical protein
MKKVIYRKIEQAKIKKFKPDVEKKARLGILIGDIFYDLTKEVSRIKKEERDNFNKNLLKAVLKKSEKIIDKPTKKTTHIIISLGDLEKLNLRG